MKKQLNLKSFKHILVYSLNYIGDTLFTTPVFPELKRYNPNIIISAVVGNQGGVQVLKNNPYIDHIIEVKGKITAKYSKIKTELKNPLPEISLILENSFESALICMLLGIPYRIGIPNQGRSLLLTHRTKNKAIHSVDKFMSNLSFFSNEVESHLPSYFINLDEVDGGKFNFTNNNLIKVALVPSTTNNKKRYSIKNYITLINYIITNIPKSEIYIIGSIDAKQIAYNITSQLPNKTITDLSGKTDNLSELGYVLRHMNVVIGGDTGPLHLSNALLVPTIFLFHTPKLGRTAPYNQKSSLILYPKQKNKGIFKMNDVNMIDPETIYTGLCDILNSHWLTKAEKLL